MFKDKYIRTKISYYNDDYLCKYEYNESGNEIYYEDSKGYWKKKEYDLHNNIIYYETSVHGIIRDKRNV